jgi:2-polyprenyl-6-methoxyphenol hydroxylase-like FAD-dependent oxidoreductase
MVGRFTRHNDRTLFLFVFRTPEVFLGEALSERKALLRRIYGHDGWECAKILAELDRTDSLYFDRVSQVRMPRWTRERVALVGDAAFCASLLAGQGSALAMISAYVLAGELLRAGGRYQDAFERYEARLRDYIERKQRGAERFAGAFAPRTRAGLFFRNQVIRTFAIPGLARLAVGRDIADRLELPNYDWPLLHQLAA